PMLGHLAGWPSPAGGAARLATALAAHLAALGGRVRTGAPVRRVLLERGRAAGVELAGGERVAGTPVLADVSPRGLLALAGGVLPERYAGALRRYRYGPPTLKLDWALAGRVPWTAPAARLAGTVHVGGDDAELQAAVPRGDAPPARPFLLFGQQTVADPTRAPAGRHTAWAYTHGPHGTDW